MNRRLLYVLFAAFVTAPAGIALAQPDPIAICRQSQTDAARIACLEAALAERLDVGANPQPNAPEHSAGRGDPPPAPAPRSSAPEADTAPVRSPAPDGIGARQVRQREPAAEATLEAVRDLRVAGYSQVPYRRLQVELENGQVWRQIAGDSQRLRADLKRNQTVDIEETRLGGYRLRLNQMGRTLRVERIR